jgi:SpoVK/Ycf46/Vps4 family AAA+-type ATPase
VEEMHIAENEIVQLARLALVGKPKDIQLYVRKLVNRYRLTVPGLSSQLGSILRDSAASASPLRGSVVDAIPVDLDSRLQLARPEYPVVLEGDPVLTTDLREKIDQVVLERGRQADLMAAGLHATKSALFTGAPGVGKTLAARWIAQRLDLPLITLDLSAVMSSFLGRTGNNVRNVLDYAKGLPCVFLLDEFDAIAKRRDDAVEIGELKRLVTVLLQEIDEWPSSGLLIAATNHPELLDPAIWRRFELVLDFPMPTEPQLRESVLRHLGQTEVSAKWSTIVAKVFQGMSFAEADREIFRARRYAIMHGQPIEDQIKKIVLDRAGDLSRENRADLALGLVEAGLSQREAHDWTGVSRDTIRKATNR